MHPQRTKRLLFTTALVLSAGIALSGCSGAQPVEANGPVKITFSSWTNGAEQMVEAFNDAQDDIQVTFQKVPGAAENSALLVNQVKAGDAPDVVTTGDDSIAALAMNEVLTDLSDVGGTRLLETEFPTSMASLVSFGGSTWAIPYDAAPMVLFYRADLFEQYGLEVPTTWEEYLTTAEAVKASAPEARLGLSVLGDPALYAALAWQNGAKWTGIDGEKWHVDIDSVESRESADVQQQLLDRDLVWNVAPEVAQQYQADGKVLSVLSAPWYAAALTKTFADQTGKWRVAAVPSPADEPRTAMYGGSSYGISSTSQHREAAMEFITWITTDPRAVEARLSAGVSSALPASPSARAAASSAFDTSYFGDQDIYAVADEAVATIQPGWIWGPASATTSTALNDATAAVRTGTAELPSIFAPAQKATVEDMQKRGLTVD